MTNFWVHRGSNDIIFVVEDNADQHILQFGEFLASLPANIRLYAGSYGKNYKDVSPDWEKLISIEVQTKKWLEKKCSTLHFKFYFEQNYAETLIGKFKGSNYIDNIIGIAEYWDERSIGEIMKVFDDSEPNRRTNVAIMQNTIAGNFGELRKCSLPRKKNIYLIRSDYRNSLLTFKEIFGV